MNPSDSWWGLLLSGLIGSIIGGFATFVAVWLAIRHDRLMRREDRLADAVGGAYAAASLYGSAMNGTGGEPDDRVADAFEGFLREASVVIATARIVAPGFTTFFSRALEAFAEEPTDVETYLMVNACLHHWIADPTKFENGKLSYEAMRSAMEGRQRQPAGRSEG